MTVRASKIPEWKLDSFDWLPLDQWNPKNLFGPSLGSNTYCKVCDEYILLSEVESHLNSHIKQKENIVNRKRKEAKERRLAALKEKRENGKST